MGYKSLNYQPEYIKECIKHNYNVLLRYSHKNKEFDRHTAYYTAGKIINPDNMYISNIVDDNIICVKQEHPATQQNSILMIDLNLYRVDVLNLDEII